MRTLPNYYPGESLCWGKGKLISSSLSGMKADNSGRTPPMEAVKLYIKTFVSVYRGHGGVVENDQPLILMGGTDSAEAVMNLFFAVGNKHKMRPQLLMIVLDGKNPEQYARVKKSADCRFGVVSQCIQSAHLMKNQQQYHSNVCMKINAKLGGTTCRVALVSSIHHPRPQPMALFLRAYTNRSYSKRVKLDNLPYQL